MRYITLTSSIIMIFYIIYIGLTLSITSELESNYESEFKNTSEYESSYDINNVKNKSDNFTLNFDEYIKNKTLMISYKDNAIYNLENVIKSNEKLCQNENELCDKHNNFIGPILNNNLMFYLSIFKSDYFSSNDFSYNQNLNIENGHIFLLQNVKVDTNETLKNNRTLHNLGRRISAIYIINNFDYSLKWKKEDKYESFIKNGINGLFIEFDEGSQCENNLNVKYSSIIFLKCNSNVVNSIPQFNKYENCIFYFTWMNRDFCNFCFKNDKSLQKIKVRFKL